MRSVSPCMRTFPSLSGVSTPIMVADSPASRCEISSFESRQNVSGLAAHAFPELLSQECVQQPGQHRPYQQHSYQQGA